MYLTGESYVGVYVFMLAYCMFYSSSRPLKLAGIAIGNPVFSCSIWRQTSNLIQMQIFYWHGLLPLSVFNAFLARCSADPSTAVCSDMVNDATALIGPGFDPGTSFSLLLPGAKLPFLTPVPL